MSFECGKCGARVSNSRTRCYNCDEIRAAREVQRDIRDLMKAQLECLEFICTSIKEEQFRRIQGG